MENVKNNNILLRKFDRKNKALFIWMCSPVILAILRFILNFMGIQNNIFREIMYWIFSSIPLIYLILGKPFKNIKLSNNTFVFILIYMFVLISLFFTLLLKPEMNDFYFRENYGIDKVFRPDGAIFAFLLFSMLDDPDDIFETLLDSAYVLLLYQIVVVLLPVLIRGYWIDISPGGSEMHIRYSLSFGYEMCYLLIIFLIAGMKKHNKLHYMIALLCFVLMLSYGGRGSFFIILLFTSLMLIFAQKKNEIFTTKRVIIGTIILFITAIIYFNFDKILLEMSKILSSKNIDSRNIEKLIDGSFSEANGRDVIWRVVINAIKNGGLFGYGFFGDRPFVYPYHVAGYSHNIFLELLISFGLIGVLVIIYILRDIVKMLIFCKDKQWKILYIILMSVSCKLLISFSLWYVWQFWAAAGIAFKYRNNKSKK